MYNCKFNNMRFVLLAMVIFLASCNLKFKKNEERIRALNSMQQADVDFSNASKEKGMRKAFLEYLEDDGVLLRPNHYPIVGADAIEFISSVNDSSFSLTWRPSRADVAQSGDLGYTYGMYTLKSADTTIRGTYVSIWHKNKEGKWKFVLDSGNEGVGVGEEPENVEEQQ
jgi:ketosteroid isomerase-like protein